MLSGITEWCYQEMTLSLFNSMNPFRTSNVAQESCLGRSMVKKKIPIKVVTILPQS